MENRLLLVKNTEARIHTIKAALPDTLDKTTGGPKAATVLLHPGVNKAPEHWDLAKTHPATQALLDAGVFVEIETQVSPAKKGAESAKGLMGVSPKEAIKVVNDTLQASLLHEWLASETREGVIKAMMAQLDKIDPRKDTGKK